jgi:hypothetical protein
VSLTQQEFNSKPLHYETGEIHCYCGKDDDGLLMVDCDSCGVFFHSACIGKTESELQCDWSCGYCLGKEDEHGNQLWEGALKPKPGKVRAPKPKPRNLAEAQARLRHYANGGKEIVGPRNWDEVVQKVKDHAVKLRGKEQEKYAKAEAQRKEGGHHVYDTIVGNDARAAPITDELIDFLEGNGLLDV